MAPEVVIKSNPSKFVVIQEKGIDPFKKTRCPFCLSYLQLSKFLISKGKKGFDRGHGKCPECEEGMRLQTLVKMEQWIKEGIPQAPSGEDVDPYKPLVLRGVEAYAAWVYEYRKNGFFQKIKFPAWAAMLKSMGWADAFWKKYRQLKGDLPTDEEQKRDEVAWAGYEASFQ